MLDLFKTVLMALVAIVSSVVGLVAIYGVLTRSKNMEIKDFLVIIIVLLALILFRMK
jgi:hypothetical protein